MLNQNILHSNNIPRCLHKIQDVSEKGGHTLDKCSIDQNKENRRVRMRRGTLLFYSARISDKKRASCLTVKGGHFERLL